MADSIKKTTKVFTSNMVIAAMKANGSKPSEIIAELEIALNMAKRGASTYYYNNKKKSDLAAKEEIRIAKNTARRAKNAAKKEADQPAA